MNDPAATSRKGYWSQENFSAPRIGRSAAVATDLELIAELRRRGERDPRVLALLRLMFNLAPQSMLDSGSPIFRIDEESSFIARTTEPGRANVGKSESIHRLRDAVQDFSA